LKFNFVVVITQVYIPIF